MISCSKDSVKNEQKFLKIAITNTVLRDEPLIIGFFKNNDFVESVELEFDQPYILDSIPLEKQFNPQEYLQSDSIVVYYYNQTKCIKHLLKNIDNHEVNLRNIFNESFWYRSYLFPFEEDELGSPELRDYEYTFTGGQLNILRDCTEL